jgi:molecular chaperone HscB
VNCESCHAAGGSGLLCQACGTVLPQRHIDEFAVLGVPRRFELANEELEARHRQLSRAVHPDRWARAQPRVRLLSVQAATTLNQAMRTLRDPLRRAEALLRLEGVVIADNERAEPELIVEMMELNEALDEARVADDAAAITRIVADVRARREQAFSAMTHAFAVGGDLGAIKAALIRIRYYDRLLEAGAGAPAHAAL